MLQCERIKQERCDVMTEFLNVGKIVNTQGIKGEVRVISVTDFVEERYKKGTQLYLFQEGKEPLPLIINSYRKHKNFDVISFKDYGSINDVEKFRDGMLKIKLEDTQPLGEHEFYYYEIIGSTVFDEHGEELGKIKEILSPGANDVWVVQRQGKKDVLLPYIESVVKKIDTENKRIDVEIPEGLIDDED